MRSRQQIADLKQQLATRDETIAGLREQLAGLGNAAMYAARAMDKTDAAELDALRRRVTALEGDVADRDRDVEAKREQVRELQQRLEDERAAKRRMVEAKDAELEVAGKQSALLQRQLDKALGYSEADQRRIYGESTPFEIAP